MDLKKIFIKDANPTKIGGQAVIEGVMMKGEDRKSLVVRLSNNKLYLTTEMLAPISKWRKVPIIRGVLIFVDALVTGIQTLSKSAELLEAEEAESIAAGSDEAGSEEEKESRFERWLIKHFGDNAPMRFMIGVAVIMALALTIGVFIIVPTWLIGLLGGIIKSGVALNIIEGLIRILFFVIYIVCVSKMKDIQTVFRYHGAEHKTIHCFENGFELKPENCREFETLHPRCGTSFLMFVMVIALLLFSLLGWPNLLIRITSRLVLVPVIAGLSFELLRYAGSSTSWFVKILSYPGLLLQKLTTMEPTDDQVQVAIAAIFAVLVPKDTPVYEGFCGPDGRLLPESMPPVKLAIEGAPLIKAGYVTPFDIEDNTGS